MLPNETRLITITLVLTTFGFAETALGDALFYNAAVSFSCVAEDSTDSKEKLVTIKGNNREIIALCNNLNPYDSDNNSEISTLTKEQAVVMDSDYQLRVINRCTGQTLCQAAMADEEQCSVSTSGQIDNFSDDSICTIFPGSLVRTGDGTLLNFNGSLRCKDRYTSKTKGDTTTQAFQSGCVGQPSIGFDMFDETVPCTMNLSTSSEFTTPKNCEVPQ